MRSICVSQGDRGAQGERGMKGVKGDMGDSGIPGQTVSKLTSTLTEHLKSVIMYEFLFHLGCSLNSRLQSKLWINRAI